MERLNKIFAEWAKQDKRTELKSEKVELTVVGDIAKAVKSMSTAEKSVDTISSQAKKAKDKHENALVKAYQKSLDDQDNLNQKLFKLEDEQASAKKALEAADKAAKGLGLSAKEIPGYTQLQNSISDFPKKFNAASDEVQEISQATI